MLPNPQLNEFWRVHPEYIGKQKRFAEFTLSILPLPVTSFANRAVYQADARADFIITGSSYGSFDAAYAAYNVTAGVLTLPTMLTNGGVYNINNTTGTQGPAVGIGISLALLIGGGSEPAVLGAGTNYQGTTPPLVWSWPMLLKAGSYFQCLIDNPINSIIANVYLNFIGVMVDQ